MVPIHWRRSTDWSTGPNGLMNMVLWTEIPINTEFQCLINYVKVFGVLHDNWILSDVFALRTALNTLFISSGNNLALKIKVTEPSELNPAVTFISITT